MTKEERENQIALSLGEIESVPKATWALLFGVYRNRTFTVVALSVVLAVMHPVILFVGPLFYGAIVSSKVRSLFIKQFGLLNNLAYGDTGSMDTVSGRLFEKGRDRKIYHVLSGKSNLYPIRMFDYQYSLGSGKNRNTESFTVFEFTLEKTKFPHILLHSKSMWFRYGRVDNKGEVKDKEISLEGEFAKTFSLYTTDGYEIEALQIFTKEVLGLLKEKGDKYSIEFADNKVYIYDDVVISNKKSLAELYSVSLEIIDMIGPLLNRLHDDFDSLHPYYNDRE